MPLVEPGGTCPDAGGCESCPDRSYCAGLRVGIGISLPTDEFTVDTDISKTLFPEDK